MPESVITRCSQKGARVLVYGRSKSRPDEPERLLFEVKGALESWSPERVTVTDFSGLEADYGPDGREDDDSDLIERLRAGDSKAIWSVFFLAAVLLVAWATGSL